MPKNIKSYYIISALLLTAYVFVRPMASFGQVESTSPSESLSIPSSGHVINRVIASIEGDPITYEDIKAYLKTIGRGDIHVYSLSRDELAEITQELLSSRLVEKEAEALQISVANEEIADYIHEVRALNGLSPKQFEAVLESRGLTMAMYKEQVRRDVYRNKIVMMVIRNTVSVSDEDIDRYLKENPSQMPQKGQIGVEQLYYEFAPGMSRIDKVGTRKKLEMVLQRAKERSSLANVDEAHYSDLGFVSPDDLKYDLRSALDNLKSGEISDLIETDEGMYILRVTMKSDDPKEDVTVRAKIRDIIFNEKYPHRVEKYFSEDLPKKYFIEMKV